MEKRRITVFVLIDALGWKYLENRDFLNDVLPWRRPLRTVLGFSSGAIPTMLTGEPPAVTGHWNLFYYDPAGSPFGWLRRFGFLPDRMLDNRLTRKFIKELGRRFSGMGGNFECCVSPRLLPWFNFLERRDIYGRNGILGAKSVIDEVAEAGLPYRVYTYHDWTDGQILQLALRDVEKSDAVFFFVYLSEMDLTLHNHWNNPGLLEKKLDGYADRLRAVFNAARTADPGARLIVASDHGMAPVRSHYDLHRDVNRLGLKMPQDYLAVYDSTMARFWLFSDGARDRIARLLNALECGRVVPDDELTRLGIFFPDRRYGEIIFLLNPGVMFSHSDFNGLAWMPSAMHGYHPDDPYSDAIFLSNAEPSLPVSTIADVYRCLHESVWPKRVLLESSGR